MSCLVVTSGREKGRTYQVAADRETVIGRVLECDVCLSDGRVSRRNAVVFVGEGGYFLKDLGSANGTYLNGERVTEAQLKDSDKVRVGVTELEFHQTERFEDAPTKRIPGDAAAAGRVAEPAPAGAAAPAAPAAPGASTSAARAPARRAPARKLDTQAIEFCARCSGSVSAASVASGAARRQGSELICAECAAKEQASREAAPEDVLRLAEEVSHGKTPAAPPPGEGGGDVISLDEDDVPRLDGDAAAAEGAPPLPGGKD